MSTRAALVALAGCGASPPPPIAQHVAPRPTPTRPAPTIDRVDYHVEVTGLPAIAADGSLVVYAHRDTEPLPTDPVVTLVASDLRDRVIARIDVAHIDIDDPQPDPTLAKARKWLNEQHAANDLVPMYVLEATDSRATGDGISIDWHDNKLAISRGGAAPYVRTTPDDWVAPAHHPAVDGSEQCNNEAFLLSAAVDLQRSVAVVVIGYAGYDPCGEPAPQDHVVRW